MLNRLYIKIIEEGMIKFDGKNLGRILKNTQGFC